MQPNGAKRARREQRACEREGGRRCEGARAGLVRVPGLPLAAFLKPQDLLAASRVSRALHAAYQRMYVATWTFTVTDARSLAALCAQGTLARHVQTFDAGTPELLEECWRTEAWGRLVSLDMRRWAHPLPSPAFPGSLLSLRVVQVAAAAAAIVLPPRLRELKLDIQEGALSRPILLPVLTATLRTLLLRVLFCAEVFSWLGRAADSGAIPELRELTLISTGFGTPRLPEQQHFVLDWPQKCCQLASLRVFARSDETLGLCTGGLPAGLASLLLTRCVGPFAAGQLPDGLRALALNENGGDEEAAPPSLPDGFVPAGIRELVLGSARVGSHVGSELRALKRLTLHRDDMACFAASLPPSVESLDITLGEMPPSLSALPASLRCLRLRLRDSHFEGDLESHGPRRVLLRGVLQTALRSLRELRFGVVCDEWLLRSCASSLLECLDLPALCMSFAELAECFPRLRKLRVRSGNQRLGSSTDNCPSALRSLVKLDFSWSWLHAAPATSSSSNGEDGPLFFALPPRLEKLCLGYHTLFGDLRPQTLPGTLTQIRMHRKLVEKNAWLLERFACFRLPQTTGQVVLRAL